MSKRNTPEAKRERKFWRLLKKANESWNAEQYREIDGKMYPYHRQPWDIVESYKAGLIDVQLKGHDIVIRPAIYKLMEAVRANKDSKIIVKLKDTELFEL